MTTTTTTTEILTQAFTKILTEIYNLVHRKNPSINTKPTVAPTSTEVTLSLPLLLLPPPFSAYLSECDIYAAAGVADRRPLKRAEEGGGQQRLCLLRAQHHIRFCVFCTSLRCRHPIVEKFVIESDQLMFFSHVSVFVARCRLFFLLTVVPRGGGGGLPLLLLLRWTS